MTDTDTVIATLRKNAAEDVRVALTEYRGHPLVDLRIFAEYQSTGEVGPTKKGLTFSPSMLPGLIEALQAAEAESRRRGLL